MTDYLLTETSRLCPYCNAAINLLIDTSIEQQHYIEDCEVCCRPITVSITFTSDSDYALNLFQENEVC